VARGRLIRLTSGKTIAGPRALRSKEKPWGLPSLTKDENIQLRQGTAMGQRSLQGFKEGLEANRILSLNHLWNSLIWETPEARELLDDARVYFARVYFYHLWTCLITNDEGIFRAVDRPTAPGIGGCDHTRCTRPSKGSGLIQRKRPSAHGIFVRPMRRAFGWPWTGGPLSLWA